MSQNITERLRRAERLLRLAYPHISPTAVDPEMVRNRPVSECYINTMVRQYLDAMGEMYGRSQLPYIGQNGYWTDFQCPECGGNNYSTSGEQGNMIRHCHGPRHNPSLCDYEAPDSQDHVHFRTFIVTTANIVAERVSRKSIVHEVYPHPPGQKFRSGSRVKIADKLESSMSTFPCGVAAIVIGSSIQLNGGKAGNGPPDYALWIDGKTGMSAWYSEHQLTQIEE